MALPLPATSLEKLQLNGTIAFPLIIRETTGDSRQIILRGRSMPYRGVSFTSELRVKTHYFPGNPNGQGQVLGPQWGGDDDTKMSGRWSDIHLSDPANAASLYNFPAVGAAGRPNSAILGGNSFASGGSIPGSVGLAERARTLRDAFYLIQRGGQKLRVEWGSIVRYGWLKRFDPVHDLDSEIRWETEWVWVGDNDAPVRIKLPLLPDPSSLLQALIAALQAFLDEANRLLGQIIGSQLALQSKITRVATALTDLINLVSGFASLAFAPLDLLGTLEQALTSIILAVKDLIATLRSIPAAYGAAKGGGSPAEINYALEAAAAILFQARRLGVDMATTLARLGELRSSEILTVTVLTGDQTLRDLALRYYGDAAAWGKIAEYNELTSSTPPSGTLIRVPR